MLSTIVGQKKHMDQAFIDNVRVPVTLVKAGPCVITQIKTTEKDGYKAIQIGFGNKNTKKLSKPMKGHLKGATNEKKASRFLCEVEVTKTTDFKVGDLVTLSDIFSVGDVVSVTGRTKGKGFAGVVKRWGFSGYPRTHGHHGHGRSPGSIGQGTTPGRVRKGKKMAGRMGNQRVMTTNLRIISINSDSDEMAISGTVPGSPGSFLLIHKISSGKLDDLKKQKDEVKEQEVVKEEKPEMQAVKKEEEK